RRETTSAYNSLERNRSTRASHPISPSRITDTSSPVGRMLRNIGKRTARDDGRASVWTDIAIVHHTRQRRFSHNGASPKQRGVARSQAWCQSCKKISGPQG